MNFILSIIIPSYNMEAYLPQCLDSLLVENLDAVEVLVVNDGSKDRTLEIAKSYSSRFPDSIKVIDKPNGNYGSCINAALKVASGKYVKVLDADDSFEKGNFKRFVDYLSLVDVDLVISDYVIVDEEGNITQKYSFLDLGDGEAIGFENCLDIVLQPPFQMHAVTYRKSIFDRIKYLQEEGISYTDQQWMFEPMNEVRTIAFFHGLIYRYLVGRLGQTVSVNVSYKSLAQTMRVVKNMLVAYNTLKGGLDKAHNKYFRARLMQKIPSIYRIALLKTNDSEIKSELLRFDKDFENLNPDMYKSVEVDKFKFIAIPYIRYWRTKAKEGKPAPKIDILRWIIQRIF